MGLFSGLLAAREDTSTKVIGVIDASGTLRTPRQRMEQKYLLSNKQPNYLIRELSVGKGIDLDSAVRGEPAYGGR